MSALREFVTVGEASFLALCGERVKPYCAIPYDAISDVQCLTVCSVQRLLKRVSQELLAAQLGVAVCAMRASSRAPNAGLGESNRTSRLLASGRHDHLATLPTYLLFMCMFWFVQNWQMLPYDEQRQNVVYFIQ